MKRNHLLVAAAGIAPVPAPAPAEKRAACSRLSGAYGLRLCARYFSAHMWT